MYERYGELHCHFDFSNTHLTDCINKLIPTIDYAVKQLHLKGLAITDHECLSGHIKALTYMREIHKEYPDFQLVLGNEIYLCHNAEQLENGAYNIPSGTFYHFILLAKDAIGHRQLRELSSRAWSRLYTSSRQDRLPTFYSDLDDIVKPNSGHLIASTACLGGEFPKLVLNGDAQAAEAFVNQCIAWFEKDNFFIELQPGLNEDQILFNKRAIQFCQYYGYRWIITNDCHYLTADKRTLHENYLKSHEEEREAGDFYESTYFKTCNEMLSRMSYLDATVVEEGFKNTLVILDMCKDAEEYDLFHSVIVPKRTLPEFFVDHSLDIDPVKYPFIHTMYASTEPQDLWLMKQLEIGMVSKKQEFDDTNLSRINIELETIWNVSQKVGQPISAYYNLTQRIVEIMWEGGNSLVGCGRGSVGGWYLAYLMDIMQLNPITHGTHWWRHLHSDRPELPDVDLDTASCRRAQVFQATKDAFGEDKCLNVITFRTETTKAAVSTACRGLGIDNDTAKEISQLIPITRGKVWTVKELKTGREENGYKPVTTFLNKVNEYPNLLETIEEIQGLISGRGSHASAELIYNDPYIVHNSMMKAPSGINTTCWDMGDSDLCSALKEDYLTIEALDKMLVCMNLLLEDHLIEWQGSLRATYNKYLHPDVIDYDSPEMWKAAADGQIPDLFQMQTDVGGEAIKKIRPTSMKELSLTNAVMRLSPNEDMNPIDRFKAFKDDVSLWYKEMNYAGLNSEEVTVLEKYLKANYGCSIEQQDIMLLVMDQQISGFDMKWANKLRKGLAKKKQSIIDEVITKYYADGEKLGTRKQMLDYVYKYCIKPQLGYSFSANHDLPYSCIAIQEMNLYHHYPHIYWQCAVLTVNASANEDDDGEGTTNYGKIAKAIGDMSHKGVKFALPSVERAKFGFSPDTQTNSIVFGLKAINGVGDDAATQIVRNRPYASIDDFYAKNADFSNNTIIALIKAGALDELGKSIGNRYEIMKDFIVRKAKESCPPKEKLAMQNYKSVDALGLIPSQFAFICELIHFKAYTFSKEFMLDKDTFSSEFASKTYFENKLYKFFTEGVEYYYEGDELRFLKKGFDKFYNKQIEPLKEWLMLPTTVTKFNQASIMSTANALWMKSCLGSISRWEMESLSFYYSEHELAHINENFYHISNFSSMPTDPIVVGSQERKGKKWDKYQLFRIAGAILDKNKNHHTITLLTTDGVVTVKFYAQAFAFYDKQISRIKDDGKKEVLEKSWLSRGNLLLVTGIRRGDNFYPKKYNDSIYQHTVCLIKDVYDNGYLEIQNERVNPNE